MRENKKFKFVYTFISFGIVLVVWQVLTLFFPPLIVPKIDSVIGCFIEILSNGSMQSMILITIIRLTIALSIGVVIGLFCGIIMGMSNLMYNLISPIIGLFQTIPPVSWVVLALVWFGFNGKPAMFIVIISSIPIVTINIAEAIKNIDKRLLQMGEIYHFSKLKCLKQIILPSIVPYFKSALKIALGSGWKITVMGEVLTTSDGIGGMIKLARINIEPAMIIAWSIIIVILFNLSDLIITKVFFRKEMR